MPARATVFAAAGLAVAALVLGGCNVDTSTNLALENAARSNTELQHWMSKHGDVVGTVLSDFILVNALASPNVYKPPLASTGMPSPFKSPFSSRSEALLSSEMERACTKLASASARALTIPGVQPQAVADPWYSGLRLVLSGSKKCVAGVRAGSLTEVKHGVALIEYGADSNHLDRAMGAMFAA